MPLPWTMVFRVWARPVARTPALALFTIVSLITFAMPDASTPASLMSRMTQWVIRTACPVALTPTAPPPSWRSRTVAPVPASIMVTGAVARICVVSALTPWRVTPGGIVRVAPIV